MKITTDEAGQVRLGWVEYWLQALIVLSLMAFTVQTLPDLDEATRRRLNWFETASLVIFSGEYLTRLALTRPPTRYALSFFGIVDLLSILPFYLTTGGGLHSVRVLRLLRIIRILKLARYSRAMRRLNRAFIIARDELILFTATAFVLIFLAGAGIYHFEHEAQPQGFRSLFDGLWWAVCTLTTVGYGDIFPVTPGGKLFTFFILIIGLGVIAVPTGLVASALATARREEELKAGDHADHPR
jgi:voltage-gated potassium channel